MVGIQRIMIVEDESLVAEDLHSCIAGFGYEIVGIADTYEAALSLAELGLPDLALLDIRLKGERDGIALAQVLRELGIGFVYLTSHADRSTLERAEVTEPLGYLMKPFDRRELLPVLKMAIYRHQGETRLRNMERWLSTTLRSIGDGVAVTDLEGRVTYLNPAAESVTGRAMRDSIGHPLTEVLPLVDAGTGFHLECMAARAMREDAVVQLGPDVDLIRPDGHRLAIEDCAAPVRNEDGSVQGAVVIFKDASARQRLDCERREAALHMERAERLESLGVIAGGLAHDFNNVLSVIAGNVELCRRVASPAAERHLDDIEHGVATASAICRRLLEGAGAAPLRREVFALTPSLADCVAEARGLDAPGVRVVDEGAVGGGEVEIFADPLQFRQVIVNFLTNAADALGAEGGTIALSAGRRDVSEQDAFATCVDGPLAPGRYVWVEVRDDGAGMSEEHTRQLFQPFFTTKATGRGLGLSSVRGIVRRHGGGIAVESRPGRGTTCRTWWPLPEREALPAAEVVGESSEVSLCEVMVIDDDASVRGIICRLLEERGLACRPFASGVEALAALRGPGRVDAVLLDMLMPVLTGREVLQALRHEHPAMPVVLMSGYADETTEFLRDRHTEVLSKPFTSSALWTTLCAVVEGRPLA